MGSSPGPREQSIIQKELPGLGYGSHTSGDGSGNVGENGSTLGSGAAASSSFATALRSKNQKRSTTKVHLESTSPSDCEWVNKPGKGAEWDGDSNNASEDETKTSSEVENLKPFSGLSRPQKKKQRIAPDIEEMPSHLEESDGLRKSHDFPLSFPRHVANHQQTLSPSHSPSREIAAAHARDPALPRQPTVHYSDAPSPLAPLTGPPALTNLGPSILSSISSTNAPTGLTLSSSSAIGHDLFWSGVHRILGPTDKDPFIIASYLGHGSVGVVEEVLDTVGSSSSWVRKKVLLPPHLRKQKLKIIQQEAKVLKSLDHIHIVRLLGSYEDAIRKNRPATYCLLMSPVGDGDLKTFLNQSFQPQTHDGRVEALEWLQKWFICLATALKYMHAQGVRHEDIKPSNIVHRGDTIYFTDFSSSSQFEVGQTTSTDDFSKASAMYAAPEVAERFAVDGSLQRHGRGSDIFALGCVFCEMLTVILGDSVSSFHEFLLLDASPHDGSCLLYSRKLHRFDDWFRRPRLRPLDDFTFLSRSKSSRSFFQICIQPLLAEDRTSRPDALIALLYILGHTTLVGSPSCACVRTI